MPSNILSITTHVATGADCVGMEVTAYFDDLTSEKAVWVATGGDSGEVVGTGWSITQSGDTFDIFSPHIITNSTGKTLTRLVFEGRTGGICFDRSFGGLIGTTGTNTGRDFRWGIPPPSGITFDFEYLEETGLAGDDPVGDIFGQLDVDFTGFTSGKTARAVFDTDVVVWDPASIPGGEEPTPLVVTKAFDTDEVIVTGMRSTMTITLDNSANAVAATSVAFVDTLPAGLVVATISITNNNAGGVLTAEAGASTIILTNGLVPAGELKTIEVDVESHTPGTYNNSVTVTSSVGDSDEATDSLTYIQDKVTVIPDEHITLRPDARIYRNAETHSPKTGARIESYLDKIRGLTQEDDYDYYSG